MRQLQQLRRAQEARSSQQRNRIPQAKDESKHRVPKHGVSLESCFEIFGKRRGSDTESDDEERIGLRCRPSSLGSPNKDLVPSSRNIRRSYDQAENQQPQTVASSTVPWGLPVALPTVTSFQSHSNQPKHSRQVEKEDWAADVRREASAAEVKAAAMEARKHRVHEKRLAKAGALISDVLRVDLKEISIVEQQRKKEEERTAAKARVRAMLQINQTVDLDYQRDLMRRFERKLKGAHKQHQMISYSSRPLKEKLQPFDVDRDLSKEYEQVYFDKALGQLSVSADPSYRVP